MKTKPSGAKVEPISPAEQRELERLQREAVENASANIGFHREQLAKAREAHGRLVMAPASYAEAVARYDKGLAPRVRQQRARIHRAGLAKAVEPDLTTLLTACDAIEKGAAHFSREAELVRARFSPDATRDAASYSAATTRAQRATAPELVEMAREARRSGSLAGARCILEELRAREAAGGFDLETSQRIVDTLDAIPTPAVNEFDGIAREARILRIEAQSAMGKLRGTGGGGGRASIEAGLLGDDAATLDTGALNDD